MGKGERRRRQRKQAGFMRNYRMPPGSLVVDPHASKPILRVMAYMPDAVVERTLDAPDDVKAYRRSGGVVWLNVDGLGDIEVVRRLGEIFGLHPLAQEDVLDTSQRAKAESYPDQLFLVLRMAQLTDHLHTEQLSVFVGADFVLTFQETAGDCFDEVRDRIRRGRGRVRTAGSSYLAYALVDAVIDGYFPILERYGEYLEALEDEIVLRPRPALVAPIHQAKRDLLVIRRSVWPLRDMLAALAHDQTALDADTRLYVRDAHDHAVRIMDLVENFREVASSMMEVYLAAISNRMNEIMKVLTIISTIFIPLGFIASVYGMNFDPQTSRWNMPEIEWVYGYPFALGLMALTALTLLTFFRRRGWLGGERRSSTDVPQMVPPAPTPAPAAPSTWTTPPR